MKKQLRCRFYVTEDVFFQILWASYKVLTLATSSGNLLHFLSTNLNKRKMSSLRIFQEDQKFKSRNVIHTYINSKWDYA